MKYVFSPPPLSMLVQGVIRPHQMAQNCVWGVGGSHYMLDDARVNIFDQDSRFFLSRSARAVGKTKLVLAVMPASLSSSAPGDVLRLEARSRAVYLGDHPGHCPDRL